MKNTSKKELNLTSIKKSSSHKNSQENRKTVNGIQLNDKNP